MFVDQICQPSDVWRQQFLSALILTDSMGVIPLGADVAKLLGKLRSCQSHALADVPEFLRRHQVDLPATFRATLARLYVSTA